MNGGDCYFILSVLIEPIKESRFLFDFEYYRNHDINQKRHGVHRLKSNLQLWQHFLANRSDVNGVFYNFHPVNNRVLAYLDYYKNQHLSIHASDFDTSFYLQQNCDVQLEARRTTNILFAWQHFINYGMFEMRQFAFSGDYSLDLGRLANIITKSTIPARLNRRPTGNDRCRLIAAKKYVATPGEYGFKRHNRKRNAYIPPINFEFPVCGNPPEKHEDELTDAEIENQHTSLVNPCDQKTCCVDPDELSSLINNQMVKVQEECISMFNKNINEQIALVHTECLKSARIMVTEETSRIEQRLLTKVESSNTEGDIRETLEEILPCMIQKIVNSEDNPLIEKQQSYMMILSQIETTLESRLNCIIRNNLRTQNGMCLLQLPNLNINGCPAQYQLVTDRLSIWFDRDIDSFSATDASGFINISFVAAEDFELALNSTRGVIGVLGTPQTVTGLIYTSDGKVVYQLDDSVTSISGPVKLLVNFDCRIAML